MESLLDSASAFEQAEAGPPPEFAQLSMPTRSLEGSKLSRYRVYTDRRNYKLVQAETAADAIRVSGVEMPIRIHREVPGREVLVDRRRLLE